MKRTFIVMLAAALPAIAPAEPLPGADQVRTRTLDNGMELMVWPDHDIPNVALYLFVKAGGRNEYPGITGLAHYFEHMMFNGTSTRGPGEFDRLMEAAGGANNAYTTNDMTVYTDWFPVSAMDVILDLEADRMANLAFDPEVVESERGVVYSERRLRVEDNNLLYLWEQAQATAYVAHPYQYPVIGWPSDIQSWTMEDLKAFFRSYYAPNNVVLVMVGDVESEDAFARLDDAFGGIPAQEPPEPVTTEEPEQLGERRLVVSRPGQTGNIMLGHHIPAADDERIPALALLNAILTDGESSRLHQRLVEQDRSVVQVGGYTHEGFDPGMTWIYATLPPGGDHAAVEAAIAEELARVAEQGVSEAELEKARNIMLADFWRDMATIGGKANELGRNHLLYGDWGKLFTFPDRLAAVSPDDLGELAAEIYRKDNRTVGILIPEAGDDES